MALDFGPDTRQIPSLSQAEKREEALRFRTWITRVRFPGLITGMLNEDLNSLKDGVTTYKKWCDITHEF